MGGAIKCSMTPTAVTQSHHQKYFGQGLARLKVYKRKLHHSKFHYNTFNAMNIFGVVFAWKVKLHHSKFHYNNFNAMNILEWYLPGK